jgi:hypothetical protein
MKPIELPPPTAMSATRRAAEITRILAAAIVRTQRSQAEKQRAVDLGLPPSQRLHTTSYPAEKMS